MTRRIVRFLTASAIVALLLTTSVNAEDTKGKWQFGFGLSYFATSDYIRSNSDLAFVTTINTQGGLDAVGIVDERPDINILNQASIADDFKIDFSGSYGLTRWLALEIAGAYQKSAVGNIEYFTVDNTRQPLPNHSESKFFGCGPDPDPTRATDCTIYSPLTDQPVKRTNAFVPVGQITKIPIQFSGLVRFRPESPFDPYIGLGVGYTYASLDNASAFNARAREVSQLEVRSAWEGEFTNVTSDSQKKIAPFPALTFSPKPLQATVRDSFEWHAVGGVDYYVNDRISFYVDARYVWTSGQVNITADSAHQALFGMIDDGQLLLRKQMTDPSDPKSTMYLWEDKLGLWNPNPGAPTTPLDCTVTFNDGSGKPPQSCTGDGLFETEDKNLNGFLDHLKDQPTENDGVLYVYAPGPIKVNGVVVNDRIQNITALCDNCAATLPDPVANQVVFPYTEDHNYNFYMDRWLLYGVDFCTTPESVGSAACARSGEKYTSGMATRYVWPEGCDQVAKTDFGPGQNPEGCPPPQSPITTQKVLTGTSNDNAADTVLVQGGKIRLGGFSLGVGFKFTF